MIAHSDDARDSISRHFGPDHIGRYISVCGSVWAGFNHQHVTVFSHPNLQLSRSKTTLHAPPANYQVLKKRPLVLQSCALYKHRRRRPSKRTRSKPRTHTHSFRQPLASRMRRQCWHGVAPPLEQSDPKPWRRHFESTPLMTGTAATRTTLPRRTRNGQHQSGSVLTLIAWSKKRISWRISNRRHQARTLAIALPISTSGNRNCVTRPIFSLARRTPSPR